MSGSSVIAGFVNAVLIVFVMFYLLMDWNHFFGFIKQMVPVRAQETVHHLAMHTDGLLSQYLNGVCNHCQIIAVKAIVMPLGRTSRPLALEAGYSCHLSVNQWLG
jgi:predicted PurR-regulated permease PerM